MNVCMLAYTYYENDNRVMRYAETLAQRGDHVDVFAVRRKGIKKHETIRGVDVFRIQQRVINEKSPISYLAKILAFLVNSAIHVTARHFRRRYDVIHVHSVPDFEIFAAAIPKLFGAKCILDIHDIVPELYADKFHISKDALVFKALLKLERISTGFADHVIAANHIWGERLTQRSVPDEKCSVFLNYPDPDIFGHRKRKRDDGQFVMVYPGTLSHHQGLDLAIKALALIQEDVPQARLHIYGDGSEKNRLVRLASDLGLNGKVSFFDLVPISKIADVMAEADLGIVPKRADSFGNEAFSTKILEFMAVGVPVLAAETVIDKFYFDDASIQFFESGNEKALASSMRNLIGNVERLRQIKEGGAKKVDEYSWGKHKQRYLDLIDSLSDRQPRSRSDLP